MGLLSSVVFLNPNVPKCVSGIQQASLLDLLVLKVVEYERGNRRGDERVNCCGSQPRSWFSLVTLISTQQQLDKVTAIKIRCSFSSTTAPCSSLR